MSAVKRRLFNVLAAACLAICSGCVLLPTSEFAEHKPDVRFILGDASSDKPIRIGVTTKDDVMKLLGDPLLVDEGGAGKPLVANNDSGTFIYSRVMAHGILALIPFRAQDCYPLYQRMYVLRLE